MWDGMASFSLEYDGLFIPDTQFEYTDDPFENAKDLSKEVSIKSPLMDPNYSDISEDEQDFEIPCSQKRSADRFVLYFYYFNSFNYNLFLKYGIPVCLLVDFRDLHGISKKLKSDVDVKGIGLSRLMGLVYYFAIDFGFIISIVLRCV